MPETAAPTFSIKKKLTLPTFKFIVDVPFYCLFLAPIHRGTQRGTPKKRPDGTDEEPPMLAHVVNMETGEHGQIMIAEIIRTEITENFKNDSYVGHGFAITKQKRKEGKRYDPYNIDEVDVPEALTEVVKKFGTKPKDVTDAKTNETPDAKADTPVSNAAPSPADSDVRKRR